MIKRRNKDCINFQACLSATSFPGWPFCESRGKNRISDLCFRHDEYFARVQYAVMRNLQQSFNLLTFFRVSN